MKQIICPGEVNSPAFAPALHSPPTLEVDPRVSENLKLSLNHPRGDEGWASATPRQSRPEIADKDFLLSATDTPAEDLSVSFVRILSKNSPFAEDGSRDNFFS